MPHEDPVVIVVQVIAPKNVKLSLNSSHGMVDPSLQHGAAAYPFILGGGGGNSGEFVNRRPPRQKTAVPHQ